MWDIDDDSSNSGENGNGGSDVKEWIHVNGNYLEVNIGFFNKKSW